MARTVIVGQDQEIVMVVLHILSYFIRCSEVFERPPEQAPKSLNSRLESLETRLEPIDFDKETNPALKVKFETISEKSVELSTESLKSNKSNRSAKILSQNAKSGLRDADLVASKNLTRNCNNGFATKRSRENSTPNSQAKITVEKFDSCGEDSGICSTDFESSVEILQNEPKNCFDNCDECASKGAKNFYENVLQTSENYSQKFTLCSDNSTHDSNFSTEDFSRLEISSKNPENCLDADILTSNSENYLKGFYINSQGFPTETSKNCKEIAAKVLQEHLDSGCKIENSETCCENCQDEIIENSKSPTDTSFEDKICEEIDTHSRPTSPDDIFPAESERCHCNGVPGGNSKEQKLWISFLKTCFCDKNSRSLDGRCLSSNALNDSRLKLLRRCSSEKVSSAKGGSKMFVQNDGKIVSLDRQRIYDMFLKTYPLCPLCKGRLSFVENDFTVETSTSPSPDCLCEVVEGNFGANGRSYSSITMNSDSSGISLQSFEGEHGSLSSLSVDSGLNIHCLQSSENMMEGYRNDENEAFTLELPESQ